MRLAIILSFFALSFCCLSQEKELIGTVKDGTTFDPIIGVHIKNFSSKKLAVTHVDGSFVMPVDIGDSVVVSHVGYQEITLMIDEELLENPLEIILLPGTVELAEVEVNIFPEYERFKQLILETEPVDSAITFDLPKVVIYDPRSEPIKDPRLAPPTVGFRFDLDGLTKKGKEKKKLQKLLARRAIIAQANEKFNRDWVGASTKLEGDELTSFIAYCDFTPEYIVETPLFEINRKMMALLEEFKSYQSDSKQKDNRFSPGA